MEYDINVHEFEWLTADREGPAGRFLIGKADNVVGVAKALVAEGTGSHLYETAIVTPRHHVRRFRRKGEDEKKDFPHLASDPGTPPANWTGELIESIGRGDPNKTRSDAGRFDFLTIEVHADAEYADFLEQGWGNEGEPGKSWAAPRPFMVPALDIGLRMPIPEGHGED